MTPQLALSRIAESDCAGMYADEIAVLRAALAPKPRKAAKPKQSVNVPAFLRIKFRGGAVRDAAAEYRSVMGRGETGEYSADALAQFRRNAQMR